MKLTKIRKRRRRRRRRKTQMENGKRKKKLIEIIKFQQKTYFNPFCNKQIQLDLRDLNALQLGKFIIHIDFDQSKNKRKSVKKRIA